MQINTVHARIADIVLVVVVLMVIGTIRIPIHGFRKRLKNRARKFRVSITIAIDPVIKFIRKTEWIGDKTRKMIYDERDIEKWKRANGKT
jgi:hypothetical protein